MNFLKIRNVIERKSNNVEHVMMRLPWVIHSGRAKLLPLNEDSLVLSKTMNMRDNVGVFQYVFVIDDTTTSQLNC